ncbi:MAG: amidohydrolase family protein [Gordonia amarae]
MNLDDLVLISIDDHVVEPPDMFLRHVPEKYKDQAPVVFTDDKGVDKWMYQGKQAGVSGLNAVVSWPAEEWGRDPAGFAEMRPGAYDVHERVRDMSRNGIWGSMCFPTFTGFSARHLNQYQDPVTLIMVSAYNDWHIDEWCGAYPERFVPLALLPTWNPEAMCAEIRRVAAKGCRAVTMPEIPHLEGLPSYHDIDYWGPVFQTLSDTGLVMCLHIGSGFGAISMAKDAPIDNLIVLATQISAIAAQDLLWGPAMRAYPDLKFAFSEGGIGWIPFYLDRCDRHYTNQKWLRRDFGGKLPSEVFREHSLACYVTDPTALLLRNEIGIDIIAWECDYPHSDCFWPNAAELMLDELNRAGASDSDIDKIGWQNSARFFNWDPLKSHTRDEISVGALRQAAADVDVSIRSRAEWARRYHEKQAAAAT